MNNQLAAMVATSSIVGDGSWYMDTPFANNLNSHTPFAGSDKVVVGNGNRLNISNIGHSTISSVSRSLNLKNILHVPQLTTNLISVNRLCTDNNVTVEFFTNGFVVKDQASKKALLQGNLNYGLYKLSSSTPSRRYQDPDDNKLAGRTSLTTEVPCMSSTLKLPNKAVLWHFRLGHPARKIVNKVLSACSLPQNIGQVFVNLVKWKRAIAYLLLCLNPKLLGLLLLYILIYGVLLLLLVLMVPDTLCSLWMTIQDFLGCIY
ncbi:Retrovirus-related Pol polyprotein from transposon RE1 [Vitis vinifera]|uniref:Retrovirus-related Pol polyprotein from transposon RE1 n=1 Tax=Vitis vinifera TaxID=29760 RepID=A0A438K5F5_VITVI|nr:Retrovirus-related Pol polyprotein from transposon RE1 [Vitis vinifera]